MEAFSQTSQGKGMAKSPFGERWVILRPSNPDHPIIGVRFHAQCSNPVRYIPFLQQEVTDYSFCSQGCSIVSYRSKEEEKKLPQ